MHSTSWFTGRRRAWSVVALAVPVLIAFWSCSSTSRRTPLVVLDEGIERVIAVIRSDVSDTARADRACRIAAEFQARERLFLDSAAALKTRIHELNRNPELTRAAFAAEQRQLVNLRRGFRDDVVWFYSSLRTELGPEDWTTVIGQMQSEEPAWKALSL